MITLPQNKIMTIQNSCSTLSFIPTLDLMFLHKDFAMQTHANVD